MQFKLTKKEKSWIFYDVGNSAFVLMVSTILPVYFNYLAQNAGNSGCEDYVASWGYAASISTADCCSFRGEPGYGNAGRHQGSSKKAALFYAFIWSGAAAIC